MASEYKKATAYISKVDRNARTQAKMARERGRIRAKKLIKKAVATAPKGKGRVSEGVRTAGDKVRAQIGAKAIAKPARVLRRTTQADLHEIDQMGLSFPSLHDEFKKTMSLLHGGDVGDSL